MLKGISRAGFSLGWTLIGLLVVLPDAAKAQNDYLPLHRQALVIDLHNDAIYRHLQGQNIETYYGPGQFDLIKMKKGGLDVPFFALWPDPSKIKQHSMFEQTRTMLDSLMAVIERHPQIVQLAVSPEDIETIVQSGRHAACIGIEGGTVLENNLQNLDYFYRRGVRYLGLTWNDSPDWATSAKDETEGRFAARKGLTEFGRQVIQKMNELGMMIDLAHAGEQTFYDVIRHSRHPVIVSHAAVYALCPHFRNLNDEQIQALAKNGGVMGITFYPGYLVPRFDAIYKESRRRADQIEDSLKNSGSENVFDRAAFIRGHIDPVYPSVATVVDHIEYVIKLVGEDHVALGSDYSGISIAPAGLEDVSKLPSITKELQRRGYSTATINKILGGNVMRVFRQVSVAYPKEIPENKDDSP